MGWKEGEEFKVGKTIYAVMPRHATPRLATTTTTPVAGMDISP